MCLSINLECHLKHYQDHCITALDANTLSYDEQFGNKTVHTKSDAITVNNMLSRVSLVYVKQNVFFLV